MTALPLLLVVLAILTYAVVLLWRDVRVSKMEEEWRG